MSLEGMAQDHSDEVSLEIAVNTQLFFLETSRTRGRNRADERVALRIFEEDLRSCREAQVIGNKRSLVEDSHPDGAAAIPPPCKRAKASRSTRKPKSTTSKPVVQDECKACLDQFPRSDLRMIRNCKCRYCGDCFVRMISSGMKRREIARCCDQNVKPPRALMKTHEELCRKYEKLYREVDADNPMYCASPSCSSFLGNFRRTKRKVKCKACQEANCTSCRGLMSEHKGIHNLCPKDVDDSMMQKAVDKYQMKRCPKCYIVIDKNGGCRNVRCGTLFCYTCGLQKSGEWGPCDCFPAVQNDDRLAMLA